MRASWIVVVGAVAGVTACGAEDGGDLFGSGGSAGSSAGGSSAGGSSAGGSSATGGSGNAGGSAGSGVGGAPSGGSGGLSTGGAPSGGSGGAPAGGTGGTATGGTGGITTGGTGGSATGGTGGSATGGSGGSATGGTGGSATGGTGGSATGGTGGCTQKTWCKDNDGDTYGSPIGMAYSCNKPSGGSWIQQGSKAEACGDCADSVKDAFPFSSFCGAVGYQTNIGTSFDYNCDTQENACSDVQKATTCSIDPNDSNKCLGAGYLPLAGSTAKNKYCGSSQWQDCVPVSLTPDGGATLGCSPSVKTANHVTCK